MDQRVKAKDPWCDDLNDPLSQAIAGFVRQLPKEEIFGILKTTTGGLVSPKNVSVEEAIGIIIHFSDAVALLNRRRIKKDYLVSYLSSQKIEFSSHSDKSKLCNLVLKLWGLDQEKKLKFQSDEKLKPKIKCADSKNTREEMKISATVTTQPTIALKPLPAQALKPVLSDADCQTVTESSCTTLIPFYEGSVDKDNNEDAEMSVLEDEDDVVQTAVETQSGQSLAFQFAEWFYPRLNKLEDFIPNHFWKDCNFRLQMDCAGNRKCINILKDGDTVCAVLRSLIAEDGCYFNPNTLNGIGLRGIINPHGLAQVLVCGTVHKGPAIIGTFGHTFGLMKDPSEADSFKIKYSLLRVREQSVLKNELEPDLAHTTLSGIIEEIDE